MNIPFMAVGNEELEEQPNISQKDLVYCEDCKEFHSVQSTQGKRCSIESMRCPATNKCFIVGVDGKLLKGRKKYTDNSGE